MIWGHCLVGSLTGVVASKSVTEASKDALILENSQVKEVTLYNKEKKPYLSLYFDTPVVEEVDLNGQCIERKKIKTRAGKSEMMISMPRFGIKTFVLSLT